MRGLLLLKMLLLLLLLPPLLLLLLLPLLLLLLRCCCVPTRPTNELSAAGYEGRSRPVWPPGASQGR